MFIANIVVIIGTVIQAAAMKRRDMIVGRVILGIGSVMLGKYTAQPLCGLQLIIVSLPGPSAQSYTVEISHPAYRGTMMGLYNGCYFIGAIVSTWLEYGILNDTKGGLNWRLPMGTSAWFLLR